MKATILLHKCHNKSATKCSGLCNGKLFLKLFETDPAYRMYRMYTYDRSSTHHEEYVEDHKRKLGALRPAAQASLPPGSSPHVPPSVAGQSLPSIRLQQQGLLPAGIICVF